MRILWLCNIILPAVAVKMGLKPSDKEGWVLGAASAFSGEGDYQLGIAFPVPSEQEDFRLSENGTEYFGFFEDTAHPEIYDEGLEDRLRVIVKEFKPDIVHIFGTEYPHTLAMTRVFKDDPGRILIGLQGVMDIYKDHYFDGLPEYVINRVTFRDFVRRDSLKTQQKKYALRAENEVKSIKAAVNITGRTAFDRNASEAINPDIKYHFMNETLRKNFYDLPTEPVVKEPYSIFISQGNYPIKGAHYMLSALRLLKAEFPSARLYIAGDNITRHETLKDKIKISSYGKYLLELMDRNDLWDCVVFTGSLNAEKYRERLLRSSIFVCPSSIENSPNSLGEAMLLKVPCVSARVGGIPSIFDDGRDGILYEPGDVNGLKEGVARMWRNPDMASEFAEHAREHALITHDAAGNIARLKEIYNSMKH
ncbi:MAG: glycosyltransferase family 4 protein [Lachnospiraceae bacterium]|nr:glycosyltransferase family 4 protein [Lachnospiraceae bacterium]